MIQVFKPSIGEEEIAAVEEVLRSGWLGLGPKTKDFENQFAEYVDASFAVGMNSGTAALHLALVALGVGPHDEVLVPTITFVSTALAPVYCGAKPVFVDADPETLCMNVADAEQRITEKTKAIMPVHYGGHPCDMEAIWRLAGTHNLLVIEDAAHACGAKYRGHRIGGLQSDATCFSFHAVKNLTTGEGGMVTTESEYIDRRLRQLRWCGIDKTTWGRTEAIMDEARPSYGKYGWYYEVVTLGYKAHMSDIAAAIGLVQLEKLDRLNARRREIAGIYSDIIASLDWCRPLAVYDYNVETSQHNYVIKVNEIGTRDRLNLYLKEKGIATGVHYTPIHLQPYFASQSTPLPLAEDVWRRILTLPMYPDLTDEQAYYIGRTIKEFGEHDGKAAIT